jgi:hypothetical protein
MRWRSHCSGQSSPVIPTLPLRRDWRQWPERSARVAIADPGRVSHRRADGTRRRACEPARTQRVDQEGTCRRLRTPSHPASPYYCTHSYSVTVQPTPTAHRTPSAISHQPSAICHLPSAISHLPSPISPPPTLSSLPHGALAQLGEHPVCNRKVIGSIPIRSIDTPRGSAHCRPPLQFIWRSLFIAAMVCVMRHMPRVACRRDGESRSAGSRDRKIPAAYRDGSLAR